MRAETPPTQHFDGLYDNCLLRVRQALPELQGARRQVAECVLRAPQEVIGLSIGELAAMSGVSDNAVNRFARSVGYSGYRAFSKALSFDLGLIQGMNHTLPLGVLSSGMADEDDTMGLIARVVEMEVNAISETARQLDAGAVNQAVTAIAGARRLLFIGTGSAAAVCQATQYRCSNLGLTAHWTADPMVMVSETSSLEKSDVVLAISNSGQSRAVLEVLHYARDIKGVTTIAITAERHSRIASAVDILLPVHDPERSVGASQFTARMSSMVLLEALITAVYVRVADTLTDVPKELSRIQTRINNVDSKWEPAIGSDAPKGGSRSQADR